MAEKLYTMKLNKVPHSSIVGSSLTITCEGVGVVAMLIISVPQPHLDYKIVAEAVAKALMTSGILDGTIDLVLPDNFKEAARAAVNQ